MKFSIIIPLYNGAKFIEQTLNSVLAQTYKNYEIILINDGSPDNVSEVVNGYFSKHPGVKYVYLEQKNKGLGGARNTAIQQSSGEIIALLDQDDIWYPEKLEKVALAYEKMPHVSIVSHGINIRNNGEIIRTDIDGPSAENMHRALLFSGNLLSTPAVTFRRDVINVIGGFSEDINKYHLVEDYDLWLRMALAGYRFYFLTDVLGEWTLHESNFTKSMDRKMCESSINVLNLHYGLLKEKQLFDWYRLRQIKARILYNMADKLFFVLRAYGASLVYLGRMIGSDPFSLFTLAISPLAKKSARKLLKILQRSI